MKTRIKRHDYNHVLIHNKLLLSMFMQLQVFGNLLTERGVSFEDVQEIANLTMSDVFKNSDADAKKAIDGAIEQNLIR